MVGRYFGPEAQAGAPGAPLPAPAALRDAALKHILPGTFVPSHQHDPTGVRTVRRAVFGADGDLYMASRESKQILRFDAATGAPDAAPFIDGLADFPEFIALDGG